MAGIIVRDVAHMNATGPVIFTGANLRASPCFCVLRFHFGATTEKVKSLFGVDSPPFLVRLFQQCSRKPFRGVGHLFLLPFSSRLGGIDANLRLCTVGLSLRSKGKSLVTH